MSSFVKKNEKRIIKIIALVLAVVLVAMLAWIGIDRYINTSSLFNDQTFAAALADALDCTPRSLDAEDLEPFQYMSTTFYFVNYGFSMPSSAVTLLGYEEYANEVIANIDKIGVETEDDEEEEETEESEEVSEEEKEPTYISVAACPNNMEDLLLFKNLKCLSMTDSEQVDTIAQGVSSYASYSSMIAQQTGYQYSTNVNDYYKSIVPEDFDSIEDLEALTELQYLAIAKAPVKNLNGVEKLENLKVLDASYTSTTLTDISALKDTKNLVSITLTGANLKVTGLDALNGLSTLKVLDISGNTLTEEELPSFEGNTSLVTLNISENKLTSIDFKHDSVKNLFLNNNEIKEIKIDAELKRLSLSDNKLESLDSVKGITSLEELDVANNSVEKLDPLSELKNLTGLWLSGNEKIKTLVPIGGLTKLETLVMVFEEKKAASGFTTLDAIKGLKNLETLAISYTDVGNISAVSGMTELRNLSITNCKVKDISALKDLDKLEALYLSGNFIMDVSGLGEKKELQYLDLSDNRIKDVTSLKDAFDVEVIKTINLDKNYVENWDALKEYIDAEGVNVNKGTNRTEADDVSKSEASDVSGNTSESEVSDSSEADVSEEASAEVSDTVSENTAA